MNLKNMIMTGPHFRNSNDNDGSVIAFVKKGDRRFQLGKYSSIEQAQRLAPQRIKHLIENHYTEFKRFLNRHYSSKYKSKIDSLDVIMFHVKMAKKELKKENPDLQYVTRIVKAFLPNQLSIVKSEFNSSFLEEEEVIEQKSTKDKIDQHFYDCMMAAINGATLQGFSKNVQPSHECHTSSEGREPSHLSPRQERIMRHFSALNFHKSDSSGSWLLPYLKDDQKVQKLPDAKVVIQFLIQGY